MNIYQLLRKLVKGISSTGGMSALDAFDAMNLIAGLERLSVFGSLASVTSGEHQFQAQDKVVFIGTQGHLVCNRCGKADVEHE